VSKPFDAATKRLVETDPVAWLHYVGLPGTFVKMEDADLSTVTAQADRFLRVRDPDYLAHLELQAGYEVDMGDRMLRYSALGYVKHNLPVVSVLVLLRSEANGPAITGQVTYSVEGYPDCWLSFGYRVVRVWEQDPEPLLIGPSALLPLAPIANVSADALPGVVRRMEARIDREVPRKLRGELWTTTRLLLGLRYRRGFVNELLKGVQGMKESDTYLEILEEGEAQGIVKGRVEGRVEGRADEARRMLLLMGSKRFGEPTKKTRTALEAISSPEALEQLATRLFEVESWEELLN
jgi:predicted transposase YdaD